MSSAELRSSFGRQAALYAEHRPDYAAAALRWAIEPAPGPRVLDLGAGTGKLTVMLVDIGVDVVAVEPDPAMLAELRREAPAVHALLGSAEAIPLADASVDAVVVGNAMHWFDMEVASPEIGRVLTSGGVVAGLWNLLDDGVDWVAGVARVGGTAAVGPRDTPATWRVAAAGMLPSGGAASQFGAAELAEFPHAQRRTADSLTATFATKAGILVMGAVERHALLDRIRSYLASSPETALGEFMLPMVTGVARTRRR